MITRAKILRATSSPVERRMWQLLHAFRTGGYHFRKQVPIGPYTVYMACHHARLVIEVDGNTHGTDQARRADAKRDAFLAAEGYTVLRISNYDVVGNPDGVFELISRTLAGRLKQPRATRLPGPDLALSPAPTSPLVGEAGRGDGSLRQTPTLRIQRGLRPLPSPPHQGEGARSSMGHEPAPTSPLVGEARRGVCHV